MTLFQDTGADPRIAAAQLADVLAWYGAVGDAACGNPPGFATRKAAVAVSLAKTAEQSEHLGAIAFAGILHAIGAVGNAAYRKGERLPERFAKMESWDVPAEGARICQSIVGLPKATADIVRWQAESWDGTGFPDQLRWHGIPYAAAYLAVATAFVRAADPDEALTTMALQSGRAFGPEAARVFSMWFHQNGGEQPELEIPLDALDPTPAANATVFDSIADRIDEHNGVAGRWRRVARLCEGTAAHLTLEPVDATQLAIAARVYGAGEIVSAEIEDAQFAPHARLGIEHRTRNALAAAALIDGNGTLGGAAAILRARGEWYDGTGKPRGLRSEEIPKGARILATAIAYDTLHSGRPSALREERGSPAERIDNGSGTQFDPQVVRALLEVAKAHV